MDAPLWPELADLARGLQAGKYHATESAQILFSSVISRREACSEPETFSSAMIEMLCRFTACGLPPYGPVITLICGLADAAEKGVLDSYLENRDCRAETAAQIMEAIAARLLEDSGCVATFTLSKTVLTCLRHCAGSGNRFRVVLTESAPNLDGLKTKAALEAWGIDCETAPEADMARLYRQADIAVFGCEAVLPGGDVIGKVGQNLAAQICRTRCIPVYIYAGCSKIVPEYLILDWKKMSANTREPGVDCGLFERVSSECITGIITERGVVSPANASGLAFGMDPVLCRRLFS